MPDNRLKEAREAYAPYAGLVRKYALEHEVPENYARAVMESESGKHDHEGYLRELDPAARSYADARGLFQINPITARHLGVDYESLDDPEINIEAGIRYLSEMLRKQDNDLEYASTAYNWGPTALAEKGFENRPKTTKEYWDKIRLFMMQYDPPEPEGMWMGGPVRTPKYL